MNHKTLIAALLALAASGAAQAQCACNASATALSTQTGVVNLLANKMVCGNVGGERWQEWHNGTTSGPIVDYKKGENDPIDRSTTVGSYSIAADGTVTYTYGSDSYRYQVCSVSGTYTFCGAQFGGRNITGAKVASTGGLQSCDTANFSPSVVRSK